MNFQVINRKRNEQRLLQFNKIKKLGKLLEFLFERLFYNNALDVFVDTMPIEMIMGLGEKNSKVSKVFY